MNLLTQSACSESANKAAGVEQKKIFYDSHQRFPTRIQLMYLANEAINERKVKVFLPGGCSNLTLVHNDELLLRGFTDILLYNPHKSKEF